MPPPDSVTENNESGIAFFILKATLYSSSTQINVSEITDPYSMPIRGSPQHSLAAGQTGWVEIDMGYSNQDVDRYRIDLVAIAGIPIP